MTAVKQIKPYSCVLACIESIAKDIGRSIDQRGIIDQFPALCNKGGGSCEGRVPIHEFLKIPFEMKLSNLARRGKDKDFLILNQKYLYDVGILLVYEKGDEGMYHCVRVKEIHDDGFIVMDPALNPPNFVKNAWDFLETNQCNIFALPKFA